MYAPDSGSTGLAAALGPGALKRLLGGDVPTAAEFVQHHYGDWVLEGPCFAPRFRDELEALDRHLTAAEDLGRGRGRAAARWSMAVLAVLVAVVLVGLAIIGSAL